jgi:hypothetical protein
MVDIQIHHIFYTFCLYYQKFSLTIRKNDLSNLIYIYIYIKYQIPNQNQNVLNRNQNYQPPFFKN